MDSDAVAEKGREHDGCCDDEHTCPKQRYDGTYHSFLAHVYFDVYLYGRNDGHNSGNRIA